MGDKHPMQAAGDGRASAAPSGSGRKGGGESGGGAYPNPHSGKAPKSGFLGHGGQTDIDQKLKPGEPKN
jgi:hypothetical protein